MMPLYFAQVREDLRVEKRIISGTSFRNILCIGSGGCTAFSLLSDDVETILCVDQNPAQSYLIELKRAAIMAFTREEYLQFIGVSACEQRMELFRSLRSLLSHEANTYWEQNPGALLKGINKCGVTEMFYEVIAGKILGEVYDRDVWTALFSCNDVEEQRVFYSRYFTQPLWSNTVANLLGKEMHLRFFPAALFSDDPSRQPDVFFMRKFREELCTKKITGNYFLSQFMLGEYLQTNEGMPDYLSEAGYLMAQKNIHKLTIVTSTVEECCRGARDVDAFMLSNVFDWLGEEQQYRTMKALCLSASASAVVCSRNMFGTPDIPLFAAHGFTYDGARSQEFTFMERSMMYNHVSLFTK